MKLTALLLSCRIAVLFRAVNITKIDVRASSLARFIIVISLFSLAGCNTRVDDLDAYFAQVSQNTQIRIEPYPEFVAKPAYQYASNGLRSPFKRLKNQRVQVAKAAPKNCLQPDYRRSKNALESYGLDALNIAGIFTSKGRRLVLIKANDGTLHQAAVGDYMGLFHGKITAIKNGNVHLTEMLPDGAGCWQRKQATLSMSVKAGENSNV